MTFASEKSLDMGHTRSAHFSTPVDGHDSVPGTLPSLNESAPRFCFCDVVQALRAARRKLTAHRGLDPDPGIPVGAIQCRYAALRRFGRCGWRYVMSARNAVF